MSEQTMNDVFTAGAVNDTDEELLSKSSLNFGLNQGCFISKIAYNPNAGKDEALTDAFDIEITIDDKVVRRRIYDAGDLYKGDNLIPKSTSAEYIALYNTEMRQRGAVLLHAVKATGVTQEQIDAAISTGVTGFTTWGQKVISALSPTYTDVAVDVFLEWQWKIGKDQTRTFLEIPKNMKGGAWCIPSTVGNWTENREDGSLSYVDGGNTHTFTRNADFMKGNKANMQDTKTQAAAGANGNPADKETPW